MEAVCASKRTTTDTFEEVFVLLPSYCPNRECPNHDQPSGSWYCRFGSYQTAAHGRVQRFRCRECGRTCSSQTESLHYYAKRRVPFFAVFRSLTAGSTMREIARRYRLTPTTVANAVVRLGRQAMAAQLTLLHHLNPRTEVVFDGIRSFVTSQDYPCDLTTVVDRSGETILTITHSVSSRGGSMTARQKERVAAKKAVWSPKKGSTRRAISLSVREIWDYLRPSVATAAVIDTDEHPLYARVMERDPVTRAFTLGGLLRHRRTPSTAPRTFINPLFPVNYVDRLIRHRVREHMRETIAFGRNAVMQMHRMWIFAYDHNCTRAWRVKQPEKGPHAAQGSVDPSVVSTVNRQFFVRRIRPKGLAVPESIYEVWNGKTQTPPHRWKKGQAEKDWSIPGFARRELVA